MTCFAMQLPFRGQASFPAITSRFIRVRLVGKGSFVVGFDDIGYVWEAALAHFDAVSVNYFVKFCDFGKRFSIR